MSEDLETILEGPAPDRETWQALVEEGLAGASFEKRYVSELAGGIRIQPLYTKGDLPALLPPRAGRSGGWSIIQGIEHPDPVQAAQLAEEELSRGATGVALRLDEASRRGLVADAPEAAKLFGRGGVHLGGASELQELLSAIAKEGGSLHLDAGAQAPGIAALVAAAMSAENSTLGTSSAAPNVAESSEAGGAAGTADAQGAASAVSSFVGERSVPAGGPAEAEGLAGLSLGYDPIGVLAKEGSLPQSLDAALGLAGELAVWAKAVLPEARSLSVSTAPYHDAGATAAQELGVALSTGAAYLRALEAAGLSVEEAAAQIEFELQVGADVFVEIAKLRVARRLWGRVLEASGVTNPGTHLVASASWRMATTRDPWVNILRNTVASFAAAAGGADEIRLRPFDEAVVQEKEGRARASSELARRIARNTQLILRDEAQLDRVADPAAGSFYMERLGEQLAEDAWAELQRLEAQGGIGAALAAGSLQDEVAAQLGARREAIAKRKEPITGVSEFPNLEEEALERPPLDLEALRTKLKRSEPRDIQVEADGSRMDGAVALARGGGGLSSIARLFAGEEPASVKSLAAGRLAAPFEALRDRSDRLLVEAGARPAVFLANLGPVARHIARATFADNFFAAGGIATIGNEGFASAQEAADAFRESGATIAVICGADRDYEAIPEVATALREAGATRILVAGRPQDAWRESADAFIYLGADLLETLSRTYEWMGGTR